MFVMPELQTLFSFYFKNSQSFLSLETIILDLE